MACFIHPDACRCAQTLARLDIYISELEMYVHRVNVLKEDAKSLAQLVSYNFWNPLSGQMMKFGSYRTF